MAHSENQPDDSLFGPASPSAPKKQDSDEGSELVIAQELLSALESPVSTDVEPTDDPRLDRDDAPPKSASSGASSVTEGALNRSDPYIAPSEESSMPSPEQTGSISSKPETASPPASSTEDPIPGAIFAAGDKPFTDPDAAFFKANTMKAETGFTFLVQSVAGGYVVVPSSASAPAAPVDLKPANVPKSRSARARLYDVAIDELALDDFPEGHPVHKRGIKRFKTMAKPNKTHRQSYRSQLPLVVLAGLAVWAFSYPVTVLQLIFDEAALADITAKIPEEMFVSGFSYLCLLMAVAAIGKIFITRIYYRYQVSEKYARREIGILKREQTRVYYLNIRTIDVQQNLIGMLLNYGTVELSTAGSDGSEIVFENVAYPELMQSVIEHKTVMAKRQGDVYDLD